MRSFILWAIALPLLFALGAALASGSLAAAPAVASMPAQGAVAPKDCPSFCDGRFRKFPIATVLLSGETVDMTLSARFQCRGYETPLHIVIAVDSSEEIGRQEMAKLQSDFRTLVLRLDLPNNPSTRIALIDLSDEARTLVPMSNDPDRLIQAIGKLEAAGEPGIDLVIDEARKQMLAARETSCDRPYVNELMVVISAAIPRNECTRALRAANKVKREGVLLTVVCATERCPDTHCLRSVASSSRYFYDLNNMHGLVQTIERIRDGIINIAVRELTVIETMDEGVIYIPGSARSEQGGAVEVNGKTITWRFNYVPKDGVTMSYQVRPIGLGRQASSEGTKVRWRDNQNREAALDLGPAWVHVFAPRVLRP